MIDGLYTVDYDEIYNDTLTGLFQDADKRIVDFTGSLLGLVIRSGSCMVCFDFSDFRYFLNYQTPFKSIDFFMLTGSVDFLRNELKNWLRKLLMTYSSFDDVTILVLTVDANLEKDDDPRIHV